jgi:hypothetical protein
MTTETVPAKWTDFPGSPIDLVPAEPRTAARPALDVIAEVTAPRALTRAAAPDVDVEAVARAARKQGQREASAAAYRRGLAEGAEKARAALPKAPSVVVVERDPDGRPIGVTEELQSGEIVRKRIERDRDGRIVRLLTATSA